MKHLAACNAGNFGPCVCSEIRAAGMAKIAAAADSRRRIAEAIFGVMYGAANWDDPLWLHAQDLAYIAADKALAVTSRERL